MSMITINDNNNNLGGGGGVASLHLGCCGVSTPAIMINRGGEKMFLTGNVAGDLSSSSCSCSSIGKNSDDDDGDEEEVQSKYKCGDEKEDDDCVSESFDAIQALEEALPFRRGISRFYNGKSKSFTSLTNASPLSSVQNIVKPENAYTRKRRNLLASTLLWEDKNGDDSEERLSKRSCTNVNRTTTFAFAVAMNNSTSNNINKNSKSNDHFKQSQLQNHSALRSYSMADLQRCQ